VEYAIEGKLLANRHVNLIGGPSGAGKTTLMFQLYRAMTQGELWFGKKVRSLRWGYVAADRSVESIQARQEAVGVEFPVFSLVDRGMFAASLTNQVFAMLPKFLGYRPEFIYIDGFTSLCPGGKMNDYQVVAKWLIELQKYCKETNIMLLGACHTSKTRENQELKDLRQTITGATSWAGYTEDAIIIRPDYKDKTGDTRELHLLPRNGKEETIKANMREGIMQEENEEGLGEDAIEFLFVGDLEEHGSLLTATYLQSKANNKGVSRRSLFRWLNKMVEGGRMRKEGRGMYKVV
jgi:hypothetical protein